MVRTILISFLFSLSIFASHPTTEGLFRNGNNPDVSSDLVVVKMMISEEVSEVLLEKESQEADENEEKIVTEEKKKEPLYVKYLLSVEEGRPVQLLQVIYSKGRMNDEDIVDLKYYSNLESKIKKSNPKLAIYYSILSSLALNRSKEMSSFLKLVSSEYKPNNELINKERLALYSRYKSYLTLVKNDEAIKETMDNPLRPEDPEVREAVNEILKKPFLNKDNHLTLRKAQEGYEWYLKNDVLEGSFDSDTLRMEKLIYRKNDKEMKLSFDDYILFNGTHELPKNINIKDEIKNIKIRVTNLTHLLLNDKNMAKRYGEYREKFSKLEIKPEEKVDTFLVY